MAEYVVKRMWLAQAHNYVNYQAQDLLTLALVSPQVRKQPDLKLFINPGHGLNPGDRCGLRQKNMQLVRDAFNTSGRFYSYTGAQPPVVLRAAVHSAAAVGVGKSAPTGHILNDSTQAAPPYFRTAEAKLSEDLRYRDYYQYDASYPGNKAVPAQICRVFSKEALPLFAVVDAQDLKDAGRGRDGVALKVFDDAHYKKRVWASLHHRP